MLADRVDRRRLMRCASASGVLLYCSLVVAGIADALTVPHLLVVALLTGAAAGLFAPAEMSAVRTVVTTEELPTALARTRPASTSPALLGAPIGGCCTPSPGGCRSPPTRSSFAVSWVLLGRIRTDLPRPDRRRRPRRSSAQDLAEGSASSPSRPFFRVLMVWSALDEPDVNALFFVAVLRLIEGGFPAFQIGLVEAAAGACGILGALAAPRSSRRCRPAG